MLHMYVQVIFGYIRIFLLNHFLVLGIKYAIQKIRQIYHHSFPSYHFFGTIDILKKLSSYEEKQKQGKKRKNKEKMMTLKEV